MEYKFLTKEEVIEIHADQITRQGETPLLLNEGLLDSALATPKQTWAGEYLHKDVFEVGAAYLFHIIENHSFLDGNKRTALESTLLFFLYNKVLITAAAPKLLRLSVKVAQKKVRKVEIAAFFRKNHIIYPLQLW